MKTKTKAMRPTQKLTPAQAFFFKHAGYCYQPLTETPAQGRTRCAISLAAAEAQAAEHGVQFRWKLDGMTNREWTDEAEYGTWECIAYHNGEAIGSLCGVDFGPDKEPWGEPYARVVQAEIVSEWEAPEDDENEADGDLY